MTMPWWLAGFLSVTVVATAVYSAALFTFLVALRVKARLEALGATVYLTNCSSCHQSNGQGVAGAFPPLAGNATVTGNPVATIAIVKNGLEGRLVVNGQAYSGIMPAWKKQISDEQIAAVVTYIRSAWNNHASAVSLADVQGVH